MTALANKTVIFVTHQVEFLPAADFILVCDFLKYFTYFLCWLYTK